MSSITQALNQTNNEFNSALSKQKGSNLDKDSFMLLLVTQFKYQDPLNPMDDKEFIAQMAQFSSLEQLMNLNTSMEGLTTATNNQQMVNATSYIGKLVSVAGNTIGKSTAANADGKMETTVSTFRYAFGDNVVKGTLSVKDANGNTIYTEDLAGKQAGVTFEFNWNGKMGNGLDAPDGVYTVSLAAFNDKGEAVLSDQVVDATVTGVVNSDGTVYLGMDGGQLMELANVRQVTTPKVKESSTGKDEGETKTDDAKTEESKNEENKTDEGEKAENEGSGEEQPGNDEAEAKAA
ncbi:MAG: flagellar hook assembly protein FlgD [Desulfovibrio sp.]|nr:flagellar hook assembly protein FlgD [Desulfovibrio sp.]